MNNEAKTTKIAIFQKKEIRKTIYKNEWWFVIEDVVTILTDSVQPKGYIKDMRRRDKELSKGWGQIATQKGGKIAGDARQKLELESGGKVISKENYLTTPENTKRIKGKNKK